MRDETESKGHRDRLNGPVVGCRDGRGHGESCNAIDEYVVMSEWLFVLLLGGAAAFLLLSGRDALYIVPTALKANTRHFPVSTTCSLFNALLKCVVPSYHSPNGDTRDAKQNNH